MARLTVFTMLAFGVVASTGCPSGQEAAPPAQAPAPAPAAAPTEPSPAAAPAAPASAPTEGAAPSRPEGQHEHGEHGEHGDNGMMQAASDACSGKAAGADCSFTRETKEVKGKCGEGRDKHLMCRGEGEGGPRGRMMDQGKMKEACASVTEGKACSFEGPEGSISGTCKKGHQGDQLLCMPERGRGGKGKGQEEKAQ